MGNTHTLYPNGIGGRQKAFLTTEAASAATPVEYFCETVTLTSAAAATAVNIIPDARVGTGRKVYVLGGMARVNGATPWGTTANVKIQDTNSSAVDYVTLAGTIGTTLAANQVRCFSVDSVVGTGGNLAAVEAAMANGSGGTIGKGLQVKGNANGTGSDLIVTVWGVIK